MRSTSRSARRTPTRPTACRCSGTGSTAAPGGALPANRVFYTGRLRPGPHQVAVRTANRAGASTIRFRWRVVPTAGAAALPVLGPPPVLVPAAPGRTGHPMRWDWQIGRVTPLAADRPPRGGHLRHRRLPHHRGRGPHRSRPAGRQRPSRTPERSATWTWPGRTTARTRPRARVFPRRHARERVLRLPRGALGRLPPARRAQADAARADQHVRAKGLRRGRARRHRQLRPAVHHRVPPHPR